MALAANNLPPLVGPEQAAWLRGPVSMIVGTRDARHRPHLMRAVAGWLDATRTQFTVLMPEAHAGDVLADVRANGCIAVVCSQPSSHRTLQLKGRDARVLPAEPGDAERVASYRAAFTQEIGQLGFPACVANALLDDRGTLLRIHFGIEAAFEQTPGPAAGQPLAPS